MPLFPYCAGCPQVRSWGCKRELQVGCEAQHWGAETRTFEFWRQAQLIELRDRDGPLGTHIRLAPYEGEEYEAVRIWQSDGQYASWDIRPVGRESTPSIPPYCEERIK